MSRDEIAALCGTRFVLACIELACIEKASNQPDSEGHNCNDKISIATTFSAASAYILQSCDTNINSA